MGEGGGEDPSVEDEYRRMIDLRYTNHITPFFTKRDC